MGKKSETKETKTQKQQKEVIDVVESKSKKTEETIREQKKKEHKGTKEKILSPVTNEVELKKEKTHKIEKEEKKDSKNEINKKIKEEKSKKQSKVDTKSPTEMEVDDEINNESLHKEHEDIKDIFEQKLKVVEAKLNLSDAQIKSAVGCLKQLLSKQFENNSNIFARKEEEPLQIILFFSNLPENYSLRPVSIPVKINSPTIRKVCLIVRDPIEDEWVNLGITFEDFKEIEVSVIAYSELKREYEQYEMKRNLVKRFDLFLCDSHLYFGLKQILGRSFYEAKKYPFAITIKKKDPDVIKNVKLNIYNVAINSLFYMNNGPNYCLKAGYVDEPTDVLVSKIKIASKHVISHILKWGCEFDHLKSISLRFANSIELPIFNQLSLEEIQAYHSKVDITDNGDVKANKGGKVETKNVHSKKVDEVKSKAGKQDKIMEKNNKNKHSNKDIEKVNVNANIKGKDIKKKIK